MYRLNSVIRFGVAFLIPAFVLTASSDYSSATTPDERVEVIWSIFGKSNNPELRKAAPENGLIRDAETWRALIEAWQPERIETAPEIDFTQQLVIIETVDSLNRVRIKNPILGDDGDLRYSVAMTKRSASGFGYEIILVPSDGIKSVRGVAIDASAPVASDLIRVEITGDLQTGIMAVGGESTGTTITANGVTWELEWRNQPTPAGVGSFTRARVTGTLSARAGIEVPVRMIVAVESLIDPDAEEIADTDEGPMGEYNDVFGDITLRQSGGIAGMMDLIVIDSRGDVSGSDRQIQRKLSPEKFDALKRLVSETDWESICEDQGTSQGADMIKYEFLIQTDNDTIQFIYDDGTIRQKPVLRNLLELITR